jgi:hypothetical protein
MVEAAQTDTTRYSKFLDDNFGGKTAGRKAFRILSNFLKVDRGERLFNSTDSDFERV